MTEEFLAKIRGIGSFETAILSSVTLYGDRREVEIKLVTDRAYSAEDEAEANGIARQFVPQYFSCKLSVEKLAPDCPMIAKRLYSVLGETNARVAALVTPKDIAVEKIDGGFKFKISVINAATCPEGLADELCARLSGYFCGNFRGEIAEAGGSVDDIAVEEEHENVQYELPVRTFPIENFNFLEGSVLQTAAVYISDLNFLSENIAICGKLVDMRERQVTTAAGKERTMFSFTVNDGTAELRVGYFARLKTIDKIRSLKVGDWVVLTCKTEQYKEYIRATATFVDYGTPPEGFVPEKRPSKPVPRFYSTVTPKPYSDFTQGDLFSDCSLPECLTENEFVVFDLETTGLNSSPATGIMDAIIEIGAYKISGGEIKESFNTFVNPRKKLSEEIIKLTGIDQATVNSAPTADEVMPDFFKFISGCYLVGHNAANFDYKFVEYYCSKCGYQTERKIFDTLNMSRECLRLANYKLNTIADYFGISFNHHRAADDALVTAKIFIELVKLKKSLPKLC